MPTLKIVVDWDKNGNFTGTYDDISADVWQVSKISTRMGCRPYMTIADESTMTFNVDNRQRKYSPEYASSPLFGKLLPGRPIRLLFNDEPLWTGVIDDIRPEPFRYGGNTAGIACIGLKKALDGYDIYPELYEDETVDVPITDIVTRVAVPPAVSGVWLAGVPGFSEAGLSTFASDVSQIADLDVGNTRLPFIGDNFHSNARSDIPDNNTGRAKSPVSAYEFLRELMETERGKLFFGRDGKVVFWNRHHLLNDFEPDLIFDNTAQGIEYASPLSNVINYVEVKCYTRVVDTEPSTIFELVNPYDETMRGIVIPAGSQLSMEFEFRNPEGERLSAKDISNPVAGLDAQFYGPTPTMLFFIYAQKIHVEFDNRGNTENSVLIAFIVEGKTIVTNQPVTVLALDGESIAQYSKRVLKLDLKMITDPNKAQDIADYELSRRSAARGEVSSITVNSKYSAIGGEASEAYRARVTDDLIQHFPLDDAAGTTTVQDLSAENNDGAASAGVTFGAEDSPVPGETMPHFNGSTEINLFSAAPEFDGEEGSVAFWFAVDDIAIWSEAAYKWLFRMYADGNNLIDIHKDIGPTDRIVVSYVAGGVVDQIFIPITPTVELQHLVVTWSNGHERLRAYLNGELYGTSTTLGTWVGTPAAFTSVLGSAVLGGVFGWEGYISQYRLYDREITPTEVENLYVELGRYYVSYGMGDLIKVIDEQTRHSTFYHIIGEAHSIDVKDKMIDTIWTLEPADTNQYWLAGVQGYSEAGLTTYGGY